MALHNKNELKLIKGGISTHFGDSKKEFIEAFVTDTRLMGVVVMCLEWAVERSSSPWAQGERFRQYFYVDFEENGVESYVGISFNDPTELWFLETSLIGGLGGKKIPLSLKESKFLLQSYFDRSRKLNNPDPGFTYEYSFLLEKEPLMSVSEKQKVFSKQCAPVKSPYLAINYFLMRSFACDYEASSALSTSLELWKKVALSTPSTFNKNIIDEDPAGEPNTYMCHSIIENRDYYYMVITEIVLEENDDKEFKVSGINKISQTRLSDIEISMQLDRPEYISMFPILLKDGFFDALNTTFPEISPTAHFNGTMLMQYNSHNNHVDSPSYYLGNDISKIFFITEDNEFLIISHSKDTITDIDSRLSEYGIRYHLGDSEDYVFTQSVFMDFLESNMSSFAEFIQEFFPDER